MVVGWDISNWYVVILETHIKFVTLSPVIVPRLFTGYMKISGQSASLPAEFFRLSSIRFLSWGISAVQAMMILCWTNDIVEID